MEQQEIRRIIINTIIKFFAVLLIFSFIVIGTFAVYLFVGDTNTKPNETAEQELSPSNGKEVDDEASVKMAEIDYEVSDPLEEIPNEMEYTEDLHKMTHQKVKAQRKRGHLEITEERVEKKIKIAKQSDYRYRDFYITSLERWQEGHFDNAQIIHNTIWDKDQGTVGRAYGMMGHEEEKEYYESHFDKNFKEADFVNASR